MLLCPRRQAPAVAQTPCLQRWALAPSLSASLHTSAGTEIRIMVVPTPATIDPGLGV